jgi:lysozyme family protein
VTDADLIDAILDRERQGAPPYLTPGDRGGRTSWGISERAHPELWRPGPPTRQQAYDCYRAVYVAPFAFVTVCAVDDRLRASLIDFAVQSGVGAAIKALQRVLDVTDDGDAGQETQTALIHASSRLRHVNNEVLCERLVIDAAAVASNHAFAYNWMERIALFYWHL